MFRTLAEASRTWKHMKSTDYVRPKLGLHWHFWNFTGLVLAPAAGVYWYLERKEEELMRDYPALPGEPGDRWEWWRPLAHAQRRILRQEIEHAQRDLRGDVGTALREAKAPELGRQADAHGLAPEAAQAPPPTSTATSGAPERSSEEIARLTARLEAMERRLAVLDHVAGLVDRWAASSGMGASRGDAERAEVGGDAGHRDAASGGTPIGIPAPPASTLVESSPPRRA